MAGGNREVEVTLNSLRNRGCHVGQDWLTECINFFRSENNQYSLKDLECFVYDQWLLADLRDFGVGSLPPNLEGNLKTTIQGKMACQVELITDIGHSAYSQMQKVRKEDVGNLQVDEVGKEFQQAWEPKSNRMLLLTLCDGLQTIKAIEYRPIPSLKTDLIPGTKILLIGPTLCRRGVLMLEEKHIKILGGEVESLVITNAYENILARKLQLPENPDPYNLTAVNNELPVIQQQDAQVPVPEEVCQAPRRPQPPQPQQNNSYLGKQVNQRTNPVDQVQGAKRLVQSSLSWSKPTQTSNSARSNLQHNQPIEFSGSDEDFLNIPLNDVDWDNEMEFETRPLASNTLHSTSIAKKPVAAANEFDDGFEMGSDEEALLLQAEANVTVDPKGAGESSHIQDPSLNRPSIPITNSRHALEEISAFKRPASSALHEDSLKKPLFSKRRKESSSQEVSSTTDLNYLIGEDLLNLDDITSEENSTNQSGPVVVSSHPFIYLSQFTKVKTNHPGIYRIKAAVLSLINKLCIEDGDWKLSAKITDGSANLDVKFSSKVLEELIGLSAQEMTEMKKQMVANPEKKEFLRNKLMKAQERLVNLNCLLDVDAGGNQNPPLIVGLDDISADTLTALKSRQIHALKYF
ncbi:RecQ-mediated genome instability protein 1 [Frankliniella fusca]|uniref:RecQ-mediated genome instability protein 1 n=1 Tax=Frankliniella fusca TaxID=407009 RepID=A0AAE1LJ57_9NEOP|nr:RecQ-mediated genome instability protein 1 [Frankliniella fusca]